MYFIILFLYECFNYFEVECACCIGKRVVVCIHVMGFVFEDDKVGTRIIL